MSDEWPDDWPIAAIEKIEALEEERDAALSKLDATQRSVLNLQCALQGERDAASRLKSEGRLARDALRETIGMALEYLSGETHQPDSERWRLAQRLRVRLRAAYAVLGPPETGATENT